MSSLKSPKVTHGMSDIETWFNTLDNTLISACKEALSDLYNTATWMRPVFVR